MNTSLYQLIKQKSQELGRPLKIVCDWDEVLMGNKSLTFYKIYAKNSPTLATFNDFFKDYWEKSTITYKSYGNNVVTHLDVIENAREQDPEKFNEEFQAIKQNPDFYGKAPFLCLTAELIKSLKEDLISELVLVSSYREASFATEGKPKEEVFKRTFKKFPNCKLELAVFKRDASGKRNTSRWQEIKTNNPDFDIFIDDNPRIMSEVREKFSTNPEKIYVFPDYKCNRYVSGFNIYRVNNCVDESSTEDKHFALGALEYRTNKLQQEIQELRQQKAINSLTPSWLIIFPLTSLVLAWLVWMVVWKRSRK